MKKLSSAFLRAYLTPSQSNLFNRLRDLFLFAVFLSPGVSCDPVNA